MIYKSTTGDEVSLENLVRLYAAAYIEVAGERAEMSLEWMDANTDKVKLIEYVLVFDYTPFGTEKRIKKILSFSTKEELLNEMQRVVDFLHANNNS